MGKFLKKEQTSRCLKPCYQTNLVTDTNIERKSFLLPLFKSPPDINGVLCFQACEMLPLMGTRTKQISPKPLPRCSFWIMCSLYGIFHDLSFTTASRGIRYISRICITAGTQIITCRVLSVSGEKMYNEVRNHRYEQLTVPERFLA